MKPMQIPLSKLEKSPENARKTFDKKALSDLKASIRSHGLMQNLLVVKGDKEKYFVIAGARRLEAMRELQKEGSFGGDPDIRCELVDSKDSLEMSLAENTVRQAMHPADEYEAFAALSDKSTTKEIASRFGTTEKHVEQRLKLGRVAPELLTEYRAGKLNLECLMAFTLSDDKKRQFSVYKSLQGWQKGNPNAIREKMTDKMEEGKSALAKFVGLDAYKKAGGKMRQDLFGEHVYLEDRTLLSKLASEKLQAQSDKLKKEGWGWVEINTDYDYSALSVFGRLGDAKPSKAQKALAGCMLSIAYGGQVRIDQGLIKKEDAKNLKKLSPDTVTKAKKDDSVFSQALRESLASYRQEIARVSIATDHLLAFHILTFKVASRAFDKYVYDGCDVSFTPHTPGEAIRSEKTAAQAKLQEIKKTLDISWLKHNKESDQFRAFCELKGEKKNMLLAFALSTTLKDKLREKGDDSYYEEALKDAAYIGWEFWRPTKENFFGRAPTGYLLEIVKEIFGNDIAKAYKGKSKGIIAGFLHTSFADPEKATKDSKVFNNLKTWLPDGFALHVPLAGRSPKKAGKA